MTNSEPIDDADGMKQHERVLCALKNTETALRICWLFAY